MRKDAVEIPETLDFDWVAAWIEEEHRALLARLAFKTNDRRYVEGNAGIFETSCKGKPCFEFKNHAEMRHHHHVIADLARARRFERLAEMHGNLVAEEIEIDPGVGAASLLTSQNAAIKAAGLVEVGDVIGKVEKRTHGCFLSFFLLNDIGSRSL
ncbi:hypothetical protein AGR8A_pAt30020 [Agrobacterium fabrum str. J-07]|nr:hypothetical protein AGR8A_pAt30020 [Agrobacterium fabrum str. J-07]